MYCINTSRILILITFRRPRIGVCHCTCLIIQLYFSIPLNIKYKIYIPKMVLKQLRQLHSCNNFLR